MYLRNISSVWAGWGVRVTWRCERRVEPQARALPGRRLWSSHNAQEAPASPTVTRIKSHWRRGVVVFRLRPPSVDHRVIHVFTQECLE